MVIPALKPPRPAQEIPPLREGDRLSRDEFERRYEAMPEGTRAELIEGVVHMPSPVRQQQHGEPHFDFITWLGAYSVVTPGVHGGVSSTIRLDMDNEPQPDGVLFIDPKCGGNAFIDADGYIAGSPELGAEISASTVRIDLESKLKAYRRNEIREYLIWRVEEKTFDWYVLRDSKYEALPPSPEGYLKSETFPGLWLDPAALIRGDKARVHEVLQEGLRSPEHAAFVARLQAGS
jgi:putative restriction endonuclease